MLQISLGYVPIVNYCIWDLLTATRAGLLREVTGTQRYLKLQSPILFSLRISLYSATGFKVGRNSLLSSPVCCRTKAVCPTGGLVHNLGEE